MTRHALVTGAAGFIGSTLVEQLLREGWGSVTGIDCLTDYYDVDSKRRNLAAVTDSRFTLLEFDLNEFDRRNVDLSHITHVFHQAGQPGVRASWGREFNHYTHHNVSATQALLEWAVQLPNLQRLVYASSSSVYGDAETYPTSERALPYPRSPYGVTKLAAEHLMNVYAHNFDLPTTSLRYFTVYGPRQRPDMAFTRFCTALRAGTPITVYGNGHQVRDFTFVGDIVAANIAAATSDLEPGGAFNVSGGSSVSVRDVIGTLADISGIAPVVNFQDRVPGDVLRTGGDATRFSSMTGWAPSTTLNEGLRRQWEAIAHVHPNSGEE